MVGRIVTCATTEPREMYFYGMNLSHDSRKQSSARHFVLGILMAEPICVFASLPPSSSSTHRASACERRHQRVDRDGCPPHVVMLSLEDHVVVEIDERRACLAGGRGGGHARPSFVEVGEVGCTCDVLKRKRSCWARWSVRMVRKVARWLCAVSTGSVVLDGAVGLLEAGANVWWSQCGSLGDRQVQGVIDEVQPRQKPRSPTSDEASEESPSHHPRQNSYHLATPPSISPSACFNSSHSTAIHFGNRSTATHPRHHPLPTASFHRTTSSSGDMSCALLVTADGQLCLPNATPASAPPSTAATPPTRHRASLET